MDHHNLNVLVCVHTFTRIYMHNQLDCVWYVCVCVARAIVCFIVSECVCASMRIYTYIYMCTCARATDTTCLN